MKNESRTGSCERGLASYMSRLMSRLNPASGMARQDYGSSLIATLLCMEQGSSRKPM
jgi:hypothetical protein